MFVILFKLEVLSSRAQQVAIGSGVTMQEKDALPSGVLTLSILEVKGLEGPLDATWEVPSPTLFGCATIKLTNLEKQTNEEIRFPISDLVVC